MARSYAELLEEEALPPPTHKMYNAWKQCALNAVNQGYVVRGIISKFAHVARVRILDVGCGEGGISIAFGKEGKADVLALDIDRKRLIRAKVRANEEKANVDFLVADGLNIPFKPEAFDTVICNTVIEHVPEPQRLTKNAYLGLKKGGFLFLSTPNAISIHSIIHDSHYDLFGLSLMPYKIGRFYVVNIRKIGDSKTYNVFGVFTYWLLEKMLRYQFKITECYKEYYLSQTKGLLRNLIKHSPNTVLRLVVPTLILVCRKS